jgi:carboxyl-terminal processing protease
MRNVAGALLVTAMLVAAGFAAVGAVPFRTAAGAQPEGWDKLQAVIEIIRNRFVDPVDVNKILEGAISGAVRSLGDPYSDYVGPEEWEDFMIRARGNYSGVGLTIGVRDKFITVIAPVKGSPADRAGIKSGDRIVKVNGVELIDVSSDKAAEMIRGPVGTQVILTVFPAEGGALRDYVLTRENIVFPFIEKRMIGDDIGYIQISQFMEGSARETMLALGELRSKGAKGIILDLRGNPGGILDEAVQMAELFVPEGPIVSVVDREGNRDTRVSESKGLDIPLVVLVDGGSASASEIVAGAVQDRNAGTVVGTKTFGKGCVQTLINLRDGSGVRLTTAKYYTPAGRTIHGVGIEPDIVVRPADREEVGDLELHRTLRVMLIGLDVQALQHRLNLLGAGLEEDGIYGKLTRAAVVGFQDSHGLKPSGEADAATVAALNEAVAEIGRKDPQLEAAVGVLRGKM